MKTPWMILILGLCSGCGGGGGTTPAPVSAASAPAATPTAAPSSIPNASPAPSATPTHAGTASPSPSPTATPTVAAALKVIGGAPLSATVTQLNSARRSGLAHTQTQGVTNGLPILVEGSGTTGLWAGNQVAWVTNAQTNQDIAESSGTITGTSSLSISNPPFAPLSCLGSLSGACIVHPMGWLFGTSSDPATKPIGKQTVTISFGDGTSGTTNDYVYNGYSLLCNGGWVYQSGAIVATSAIAGSDIYADCVHQTMVFPKGAIIAANPSQDQYGRYETILPTLTAQPVFIASIVNITFASLTTGTVVYMQTQDGGYAKVFFTVGVGVAINAASGLALHSNASGAFDY